MTSATESNIKLFVTPPHPCSYLPDQQATTLFIDPALDVTTALYTALTHAGFRRSGPNLYRPHCDACSACQSARVLVADFHPDRSQRRLYQRNRDLQIQDLPAHFSDEHYALYCRYISARHRDGAMYPPDEAQYRSFLTSNQHFSRMVEFRLDDELLAVAAIDQLSDGLSAIYTFYAPEPEYTRRSLGSYAVLWQIERARTQKLPYMYLGYWIADSSKMRYKTRFRPLELLTQTGWKLY
ncbi:arginyltransferase [Carnimonas bestiolae]|uniref:arginyltransferase n=1 Tax=Carnimonas bestiolae TaxID=3402172 RepID=UPI003EDC48A4